MTGRVRHNHVDGLYRQLDRVVNCRLRKRTSARSQVMASVGVRYLPETESVGITAYSPVATVTTLFPQQCAGQGDSIDRISDFYAMPGFSFEQGWGPERWFTSAEVVVPAALLRRSTKVRIPLGDTAAGTPPRRCAVHDPSFERCRTGGSWNGVLVLRARGAAAARTATAAKRRRPRVKPPKSGQYKGARGTLLLFVSGKSIDIAAFDFDCGKATGRTSLNAIPLKWTRRGYKFDIDTHGNASYSDGQADENATVAFKGRFSRSGRSVRGSLRVRTPRCGDSGDVHWRANR
jgi:hypothetical protein